MSVFEIVFSPTGGTRKVSGLVAGALDGDTVTVDLTDSGLDFSAVSMTEDDVAVISVPAYAGRIPAVVADRLGMVHGNGARAVLVCVYGNRAFEDTLVELEDVAKHAGFRVIAAVAAIAEHSIARQFAAGRPDAQDAAQLAEFAQQIQQKLLAEDTSEPSIPGNRPYKQARGHRMAPEATEDCVSCGACAAACPVEFTAALVNLCSTQSCGKCTPCRVGLSALSDLLADVLEGRADESTLNLIERTARTIYLSSDCAIGYEAGAMALTAIRGFRDDFEHHIREHSCGFDREARVPCVSGCPAHVDIPGYISLVEAGRYADAVKVIRKNNPLPLVCGLVCEHPCEMHCRRGMVDDPMNILALKRFAVEHSDLNDYKPSVADNTGKRIAVIGGGPAGLSCAYYLAVMGHKVTIFEQRRRLGGMLRYGIPSYRLPRERLQAEIDWILSAGIDVELDHSVNGEELARLRDEFDAVYLAIGAHSDKKLGLPGEEAPGVESAVKMLRAIGDDVLPDLSGQRVCVIGGGNVAMDVARSAVRCGAEKVSIVYRRRICDMTAQDAEIAGAQAEGCEVLELTAPLAIETGEEGRVSGLRVQPQIIGEPRRGRPAPRAAATPERVIPCERVFVAIGQDIDSKPFEDMGIACKWGCVVTDSDGAVPNFDGLFSGGDCQTGPATVIRAINAGRVASANIDRYLGFDHKIKLDVELPTVQFKGKHECGRCELGEREAGERIHDWNLVEQGLTEEEARQEASRCLRCDHFGFGAFRGGRNLEW